MGNKISLAIFTEASAKIGTGHLRESLSLARLAQKRGFKVFLWVLRDSPRGILGNSTVSYRFFSSLNEEKEIKAIKKSLAKISCDVLLFNFKIMSNKNITSLKFGQVKTVCIDELRRSNLECDVIINPTIVKRYCHNSLKNTKIYVGPEYLSLAEKFAEFHHKSRNFGSRIKSISVSMGGFDMSGTTLKLIDILAKLNPDIKKNIVLGVGFPYLSDIRKKNIFLRNLNFTLYQNITNIESIFLKSDVVFTSGGNTLYELACLGTPAIVLYEDEHEKENSMAFEKHGFGFCLGKGTKVNKGEILKMLNRFNDVTIRNKHSLKGKEIVDGKGAERILEIIKGLFKK